MIKNIKNSLQKKLLLLTALLLISVSLLVFGLLAVLVPHTYSTELNSVLVQQTQGLLSELETVSLQQSGGIFDRFLQNDRIVEVELYDKDGRQLPLPTRQGGENDTGASETADGAARDAPVLSSSFSCSFAGSDAGYTLVVYGEAEQIAELQRSFVRVFPAVLLAIVLFSLAASEVFSRMITRPVVKISSIANKMSDMQLDWKLEERRTDELGTLEKSLNTLSQKLSSAFSDLKNANERLEADIERERILEQTQRDFFSAASHELKTPITVIKGQLEGMLLGIGVYQDRETYLSRSLEVVNTLERMVQELLTVSRLQIPHAQFKEERFDCVPIIKRYLRETEDLAVNKGLQLKCSVPESVVVKGDKLLIEKVFSNIIGNAITYAPQGAEITIKARQRRGTYLFCIENSGTHLPPEAIPNLFEAFYRVERSRSRSTGGSGLGLYIAQKILQQHGSRCCAENTETGVRFSFALSGGDGASHSSHK